MTGDQMDDPTRWAMTLAQVGTLDPASQPAEICRLCVATLGVSGAGIAMVTPGGNRGVVCSTNGVSAKIEDLQFTLGEGPCVDAVTSGRPVIINDLQEPGDVSVERWPGFMEGARSAGVRAVLAFPLRIGAISVGALDLYVDRPAEMPVRAVAAALMAADAAALALLHLDSGADAGTRDDFDARSTYQAQVHQATGMVQVQLDVTPEEALLMLRARAFSIGRPLMDVSTDVVARRLRFSGEEDE
jgi:GAF domain-containing protein